MRVNEPPLNSFLPENAAHGRRDVEVHKKLQPPEKKKTTLNVSCLQISQPAGTFAFLWHLTFIFQTHFNANATSAFINAQIKQRMER